MTLASSNDILWGVLLIGAAFVLGLVEIFVPSMGIIAAIAGICALSGVVILFTDSMTWGFTGIGTVIVGGIGMLVFAFRVLPHTPMGRGLILGDRPLEHDEVPPDRSNERRDMERALVGARGVARTSLHPVGTADIDGTPVEVLARSGVIEAGTPIRVVEVRGNEILVLPDS